MASEESGYDTCQSRMESEAAAAYQQIAHVCDEKYSVMFVFKAIPHPPNAKRDEQNIGESVDNFGSVVADDVVLECVY